MGLGKTSICLTALCDLLTDEFESHRILVIAPLRVARDTWPGEIQKWDHLADLRYSVAIGSASERLRAFARKADIYIINRENVQWLIEKSRIPFDFDTVVIDELSSFKNPQSKRFRALLKVRPRIRRIIGLTGTPSSNGLMDLWAEYRILDMGVRLGRYISRYRDRWFLPDKRNGMQIFSYKPAPGAEKAIYEAIGDITVSMKSSDHLTMPKLLFSRREVVLSSKEREVYERMKADMVSDLLDDELTASNAAVLSGKLQQMANGAVYTDDGRSIELHQRKLEALEDIVEEACGKPILVAYWYRHDMERISKVLKDLGVEAEQLKTKQAIERWNKGELQVGLIHPASAGHGLNLQEGGSFLVWFAPIWSLELYQQTNARLWRQGQKAGTVVVNHIVAKDTIDERILDALQSKDVCQRRLLDAVKAEVLV